MEYSIISTDDITELANVFKATFNSPPWNDNWTIKTSQQRIFFQVNNINSLGIKVKKEEEIIGFILGYITGLPNGKGFFIEDLCVSPEYQKMGIGKMLIDYLDTELIKKSIKIVITTTAKGFVSHDFYLKNGFDENPITIGLYKKL